LQGLERVEKVSGNLAELVDTEPWDGSDGEVVEEEEFSLEDIMKEEL
jgi:hypothetical protein